MEHQVIIQKATLPELQIMFSNVLEQYLRPGTTGGTNVTTILTRKEAAKMLCLSLPTLDFYTKEGIIKGTRIGTRIRYRLSDIETALVNIDAWKYKQKFG
jgi:excisionase family DNA binding protein